MPPLCMNTPHGEAGRSGLPQMKRTRLCEGCIPARCGGGFNERQIQHSEKVFCKDLRHIRRLLVFLGWGLEFQLSDFYLNGNHALQ